MNKSAEINAEQISDFYNKGYFIIPDLFNPQEINIIRNCFDKLGSTAKNLTKPAHIDNSYFVVENNKIQRIVWACGHQPELLNFAQCNRLTAPSAQILRSSEMFHIICQAHFKKPGDSVNFPIHQDTCNRGYGSNQWQDINGTGSYVQTLIAVDNMHTKNGPLYIYPYSAKEGHLGNKDSLKSNPALKKYKKKTLTLKAGSTLFFSPYLIHGSDQNKSNEQRRVFINGFSYPGANKKKIPRCNLGVKLFSPKKM